MAEYSDCEGSPTDSFSGDTSSMMTADTDIKGNTTRNSKVVNSATQPGSSKKRNARVGGGQTTGHGEAGNTNKQSPPLMDSSVPNSNEIVTDDAESEDEGTGRTHFKTVWGLRLDLLLLTIVVLIAAVIVKLPLGAKQAEEVTENPAIQQLSGLVKQLHAVKSTMEELKSDVKENSEKHRKQASKLDEIESYITKINDILNPSNPKEMSYPDIKIKVNKIEENIAESHKDIVDTKDAVGKYDAALKGYMEDIRRYLSTSITKQEEIFNSYLTTNISIIRDHVNESIELAAKTLKSDYNSKVSAIETELNKADVQNVQENAKHAKKTADDANTKLKIVEQHLFNKDALTAAILILFFLIIGLMLYVLKLKSSLEPSLAGGSTSRPLKGSREMEVVLHKMPSRPTLDNAVCIVCFDASYSEEYKRVIKETVGQLGEVSFHTHVIRKHADIAELPHCRLYIMCVEFTERHVIIEEQGLGLGDLKLTSYRGVGKLGGSLVILYIHDPGSRNLTDDQLYSDGVYCVKKQQELKELCEIDRFISAHNKLNTAQKKALETAISRVLNIQATRH